LHWSPPIPDDGNASLAETLNVAAAELEGFVGLESMKVFGATESCTVCVVAPSGVDGVFSLLAALSMAIV
jgi:hypothetical protein